MTSASFNCVIRISEAMLTYAFRVVCSILSASVLVCSPEARVMLSKKISLVFAIAYYRMFSEILGKTLANSF